MLNVEYRTSNQILIAYLIQSIKAGTLSTLPPQCPQNFLQEMSKLASWQRSGLTFRNKIQAFVSKSSQTAAADPLARKKEEEKTQVFYH